MNKAKWLLLAVVLLAAPAMGQEDPPAPEDEPRVVSASAKAGPIEFHVLPEIGAGLSLNSEQIIDSDSDGFFIVRIPGLQFPGFNETTTGIAVELTAANGSGVRYDIVSYTRTKIAGPAYTGVNIRIATGTEDGAAFQTRAMPVIGLRLLTISEHVPFFLEIEFLDTNRPVKASLIITWE